MPERSPVQPDSLQLGLTPDAMQNPEVMRKVHELLQQHADEVHAVIPEQEV